MKIVARMNGEDSALVESLNQQGITAKLVRNAVIVELPRIDDTAYGASKGCKVPAEVNGAMLFIDCTEYGGGMTNTGSGTVVCGLSGKSLRPYYIPRGGHRAGGTHAYFSVPNAVVTVTGYRRDTGVTIQEHRIVRDGDVARIQSTELWSGEAPVIEWKCSRCDTVFTEGCPEKHNRSSDGSSCWGTPRQTKLDLPETFDRYQAAAMAARRKGSCYHCRCVHFSSE